MTSILDQDFFDAFDTLTLAQKLLGKELIHESPKGITSGIIVETEAYLYNDKACHSFGGKTPRNSPMFGPPGTAYVYQIYGIHHCFNIVSSNYGIGEAVLIRALEQVLGIELTQSRRQKVKLKDLCSGPGKLVQAMDILKNQNGNKLTSPPLYLKEGIEVGAIIETTRIGIGEGKDEHLPYRFYIKDNKFISKP
ncbi:DNA-3-methyladenine glycosylase [Jiulongibacter sediminis]|jgi:DNA-3-methyladenine glycosylase|uniref:DNA-3-methyladenine glycosylase n=1 Tax=Jiulongibacter sediminis TaxID=1605367 RepID=UPI0026EA4DF5|nr:DNA-3-methyladenine glycosylase [Jiulongibacter sediminis]